MELSNLCEEVRSALPLFVGSDLDAVDQRAIERHLAVCGACRDELERARAARTAFLALSSAAGAAPEIWSGLRSRMIEEGILAAGPRTAAARVQPVPSTLASPARRWWRTAAAAAIVLGAALLFIDDPRGVRPARHGGELARPDVAAAPAAEGLVQPVALQPLAIEEWPLGGALEPGAGAVWPGDGQAVPTGASPVSYRGGIR